MADKKISQLTSATVLNTGDYLALVQSGQTLKIDASTLFKNIPVRPIVLEAAESVVSGALSTVLLSSKVTPSGSPTAYTLAAGTQGLEKEILCESSTSGTAVVTVTAGNGFTTLTFTHATAPGAFVKLKNINSFWYVAGSRNVTVA